MMNFLIDSRLIEDFNSASFYLKDYLESSRFKFASFRVFDFKNKGSQLMNPYLLRHLHIELEYTSAEFSMCRERQICEGSLIDSH